MSLLTRADSPQMFSVRFRSGLIAGKFKRVHHLLISQCFVRPDVNFLSFLSWWKTQDLRLDHSFWHWVSHFVIRCLVNLPISSFLSYVQRLQGQTEQSTLHYRTSAVFYYRFPDGPCFITSTQNWRASFLKSFTRSYDIFVPVRRYTDSIHATILCPSLKSNVLVSHDPRSPALFSVWRLVIHGLTWSF